MGDRFLNQKLLTIMSLGSKNQRVLPIAYGSTSKSPSFPNGMPRTVEEVVTQLASQDRVVMLGGLAVIAHRLSRPTKGTDVWLDPKQGVAK